MHSTSITSLRRKLTKLHELLFRAIQPGESTENAKSYRNPRRQEDIDAAHVRTRIYIRKVSLDRQTTGTWLGPERKSYRTPQFGMISDREDNTASLKMRAYYEARMKTWPLVGRNHKV